MSSLYECSLGTCPVTQSIFYYRPYLWVNALFLALFAISGTAHLVQGVVTRKLAFWICMILGCVTEVLGYTGRIISWNNPFSLNGFLIQICCLTLAPAFFTAAIYFCLADIVQHVSVEASRLKPNTYAKIFIPCDFVSLVLQGAGGGLASVASQNNENAQPGTNVMVAGLAFQVASLTLFLVLTCEYFWRVRKLQRNPGEKIRMPVSKPRLILFLSFFSLAIVCIFIRCVYRVIELSEGWSGHLYRDQVKFIVLEGIMVVVAVYALHIGHPGLLGRGNVAPTRDESLFTEDKS